MMIRTMDLFKIFDTVYVLTKGGPGYATENSIGARNWVFAAKNQKGEIIQLIRALPIKWKYHPMQVKFKNLAKGTETHIMI